MLTTAEVKQLLETTDAPVLSLYLAVDPSDPENQATTPAWRIWLKNALKEVEKGVEQDEKAAWDDAREWAEDFLEHYIPQGRGLVLFVAEGQAQTYELPMAVKNEAAFGDPHVAPLLWFIDEYEPYLLVLVDREKAYFVTAYLGSTGRAGELHIDVDEYDFREKPIMPRASLGGDGGVTEGSLRDAHEDRIQAHVDRFYGEVVEHLGKLIKDTGIERIILGGNEKAAHGVRDKLPQHLQALVIGVVALPIESSDSDIVKKMSPLALEHEREHEMALVKEVIGLAKSGGRGALGRDDVLRALDEGRVELLVASYPLEYTDLVNGLPQRVLAAGSKIELVSGDAAVELNTEGGIAARLYYAMPEAQ